MSRASKDRKSTRLNSSHTVISYAVFCVRPPLSTLFPYTTLFRSSDLVAGFDEARSAGGNFCLATHYWEVGDAMKSVMLRLLDHAARFADVRFVPAEDLFA